ncbi:uncharacterized protein Xport-A [Cloeon dipterum]|uniref:uncharacterized protein Xport-A n=1 Tax=Cloeon dipterum TaxID=197152 RepID=UPI00321F7027
MKKPVRGRGGQSTSTIVTASTSYTTATKNSQAEASTPSEKKPDLYDDDEEYQGFGGWLRTGEGVEYMKIFVVCNTFMVVLTMAWPHLKNVFTIAVEYWNEQ